MSNLPDYKPLTSKKMRCTKLKSGKWTLRPLVENGDSSILPIMGIGGLPILPIIGQKIEVTKTKRNK